MTALSDYLKDWGEEELVTLTCEKHGEYQGNKLPIGIKFTACPACRQEKKEAREKHEQQMLAYEARRRLEKAFEQAMIPKRFQTKSLDNFTAENDGQAKAKKTCQWYIDTWQERKDAGSCLLFTGNVGTGKTHLSTAIANAVIGLGYSALFTTVADIMRTIKSTYDKDSEQSERSAIKSYVMPDLLIIDEISVNQNSEHEKRLMFEVINKRYEEVKPTIVLTNLPPELLKENLGDRILDRLREGGGKMVSFNWNSSRS